MTVARSRTVPSILTASAALASAGPIAAASAPPLSGASKRRWLPSGRVIAIIGSPRNEKSPAQAGIRRKRRNLGGISPLSRRGDQRRRAAAAAARRLAGLQQLVIDLEGLAPHEMLREAGADQRNGMRRQEAALLRRQRQPLGDRPGERRGLVRRHQPRHLAMP